MERPIWIEMSSSINGGGAFEPWIIILRQSEFERAIYGIVRHLACVLLPPTTPSGSLTHLTATVIAGAAELRPLVNSRGVAVNFTPFFYTIRAVLWVVWWSSENGVDSPFTAYSLPQNALLQRFFSSLRGSLWTFLKHRINIWWRESHKYNTSSLISKVLNLRIFSNIKDVPEFM